MTLSNNLALQLLSPAPPAATFNECGFLAVPILCCLLLCAAAQVMSAAFSPDGSKAVTASKDGTLRVWNLAVRYQLQVTRGGGGGLVPLCVSIIGSAPAARAGCLDGGELWRVRCSQAAIQHTVHLWQEGVAVCSGWSAQIETVQLGHAYSATPPANQKPAVAGSLSVTRSGCIAPHVQAGRQNLIQAHPCMGCAPKKSHW